MLNKSTYIFLVLISTVFITCDHGDHNSHAHDEASGEHKKAEVLTLNQGQAWSLDMSTRLIFGKIESTIQHASRDDLADLKQTGFTLEQQKNELIQGCSMTGEGHNQLHTFLSTFNKSIQSLTNAPDLAQAQTAIAGLDEQIAIFRRTFK